MKTLLSNEIVSNEKITLVEREEVIKIDQENAEVLNNFLSNIVQSRRSYLM